MNNERVNIYNLVSDQLPEYVRDSYPEFVNFLEDYYRGLESPGGSLDIINNIDEYVKLNNLSELTFSTETSGPIGFTTNSVQVKSTEGFPKLNSLIQINGEIIYYRGTTENEFLNCVRGFSGITSYFDNDSRAVGFEKSPKKFHNTGTTVFNLNALFLAELYKKYKRQYAPGFDNLDFYEEINEKIVVSKLKDFYNSKGANSSFDVLFKLLWGSGVSVVKPRDFVIQASDADYRITRDLVIESLVGDPGDLVNRTLFQDETDVIRKAAGTITDVESLFRDGKEYFKLSLDYNPEIETFEFSVHPKTKITNPVGAGQTYLDVDSTLSFQPSGDLVVFDNGVRYEIPYEYKSSTQFFGLESPVPLNLNTDITTPDFAYAIDDFGSQIRVKITGVLGQLNFAKEDSYYYEDKDEIQIISLGANSSLKRTTSWIVNGTPSYEIKSIVQVALKLNGAAQYRVTTFDDNIFTLGDIGTVSGSDGTQYDIFVIAVSDKNVFDINLTTQINTTTVKYSVRKGIAKASSTSNPYLASVSANVQNVYISNENNEECAYVVSPSIPDYYNTPINSEDLSVTFSGQFAGKDISIGTNAFITGDSVFYSYNNNFGLNIAEGQYFIYKLNASTIRLATSRANIRSGLFISVFGTVTNNKLELLRNKGLQLRSQGLIRKFKSPVPKSLDEKDIPISPGGIGMFLNGVEVSSYKSSDILYNGPIESVIVSSPGDSNYDVINPPILEIVDNEDSTATTSGIGTGAAGVCNVKGSLARINVIDKGFDYIEEPKITISGGNGTGAVAKCKLTKITHQRTFNAGSLYQNVSVDNDSIGFGTFHKFRDFEKVVYKTDDQLGIEGLVNNSIYFIQKIDDETVKLHNTFEDAIIGINTVGFSSYGDGLQRIVSFDKKSVVGSVEVTEGGSGYTNKTIFIRPTQVNIFDNKIESLDHGYADREIVILDTDTVLPAGISSDKEYYVKVINKNEFRLSERVLVSVGSSIEEDFNYINNRFIDFSDGGTGQHTIKYKPIIVKLEAPLGITTTSSQDFDAKIQPVFTGEIFSVSLSANGSNYGSEEILNYNRQPEFRLQSGVDAQMTPIVTINGGLLDIIINNSGSGYNSPPEIRVLGDGSGALVVPVIKDGKIIDTIILDNGSGYNSTNTFVEVVPTGSGAKFDARIKTFTINNLERTFQSEKINVDDGILIPALTVDGGLQYTHSYAGRELRRKLLSTSIDADGNIIYRDDIDNDLASNGLKYHSPIIGWAYDGNPIYGPYGYATQEGGVVRRLKSSWVLDIDPVRPSTTNFAPGIFIEDYKFVGDGDLDFHNGRFCKTPDFPQGTYAYFCTVNSIPDSSGPFNSFLKPVFPYVVGPTFKNRIIDWNFDQRNTLEFVNINDQDWIRYTGNLGLLNDKTSYTGFIQPDSFSEGFTEVDTATPGGVTGLFIVNPGDNYTISDSVFFESAGTGGSGAFARISAIKGKEVESIGFSRENLKDVQFLPFGVEGRFVGFGSTSHGFSSGNVVTVENVNILSTELAGKYTIGVSTNILTLSEDIGDVSQTGIITNISVIGNLSFPTADVNDLYLVNDEVVKLLRLNPDDAQVTIRRSINNVSSAHIAGSALQENPRRLVINSGFTTATQYRLDREVHFDPRQAVTPPSENLITWSDPIPPSLQTAWDYYTVGVGTGLVEYFATKSPDGALEAAKVSFASTTAVTDGFGIRFASTGLSADIYTVSVFLRGELGGETTFIILEDGLTYHKTQVTLSKDWQRYSFSPTTSAGAHTLRIGSFGPQSAPMFTTPTIYVWGAQIELGSVRSTYYSTQGSAIVKGVGESGLRFIDNAAPSERKIVSPGTHRLYIPNHALDTNDLITYRVESGKDGIKVSTGVTDYRLEDGDNVYVARFSSDIIGISTAPVGVGSTGGFTGIGSAPIALFDLIDYGNAETNSFETNQTSIIKADVQKKVATVTTKVDHGLQDNDDITFEVVSGVQTSVVIAYDDINRRMIANPKNFVDADVSVEENTIKITQHGFVNGQKVVLSGPAAPQGLSNGTLYYVIVLDDNTIQLSNFYYDVISSSDEVQIIDIQTQSSGTLSPINPELLGTRNSTIRFDLSDPSLSANSLPAFQFRIYTDADLTTEFYITDDKIENNNFNVSTFGDIGLQPDANLELIIDDNMPDELYYNLVPIRYNGAAQSKLEILSDKFNIVNSNKLSIVKSKYTITASITGVTTNTYNYTLDETPEREGYSNTEALLAYKSSSSNAIGPVEEVSIDSIGRGYRKLPYVKEVVSIAGTNAIFLPESRTIGRVDDVVLTDIGFDYPSDKTLRPSAQFPYTYKIEPLSKLEVIKIINPGTNYFIPPQLVVLDGFTGRLNSEVKLTYDIGDTDVTIVRNTTGLYNVTPKILPVNNPNGIRIETVTFNNITKKVTVGFAVTFANDDSLPFRVGDKVIVENTNIDNSLTGKGYNSSQYGYALFTVETAVSNDGGELPSITYDLSDYLLPGEIPGNYDAFDSFGTVTPEPYFPTFDITIAKDTFREGEVITAQDGNTGIVQKYDIRNEYLKIRSKIPFGVDDLIVGQSSQNKGVISSVEGLSANYSISSNSITKKGFLKSTGKVNESFQRLHDNDYYQYFSYAVRSPITYDVWNPLVSNLNHTSGFKKFSELTVDSYDPSISGIGTNQNLNTLLAVSDLTQLVDLNTVKDFDIGREKTIDVDGSLVSNEILFNLPFLAKYQEFIGNRVLTIDDFSELFDGDRRGFPIQTQNNDIFNIVFDGSDAAKVSVGEGTLNMLNHYFVSGEVVEYIPPDNNPANSICISATDFGPGIGTTTLLPSRITIIKQDNQKVRVATSATNALQFNPIGVGLTGVGIGSTHIFRSIEPNNRLLITINGTIQSPMVGSAITTASSASIGIGTTVIDVVGVSSIFGGDLIRIDNEIMLIAGVDNTNNKFTVRRGWMGTTDTTHSNNVKIVKQIGNYNVVENNLHFIEGPWGNLPVGFGSTALSNNEIDYTGLTTSSRFSGRIFLRSALSAGFTTQFTDAYDNNYVYDDISNQFNGINTSFYLKYEGKDIDNVVADNTILLIDDIFQGPQRLGNVITNIEGDYKLEAGGGQLLLGFTGEITDPSEHNDINVNQTPRGGVIVSVASKPGYGFQPLVAAGGTAVVSAAGTITNVAIGNSGSGYRSGLQTVNVGIQTKSLFESNITQVGIATIVDGHVVGLAITNPQVFYAPREISNIGYSSITGITTVTTNIAHNLNLGDFVQVVGAAFTCDYYPPVDVTNALYDNVTGIMTVTTGLSTFTVSDFKYDNVSGIATITTIEPMKIVPMTAIGRSFSLAGLALSCVGYGQTFAVSNFQYDNTSGLATVTTTVDHGLSASDDFKMRELIFSCNVGGPTGYGQTFTITQFKYDNITGLSTITTSDPIAGIIGIGSDVRLDNLEFSCPGGSGVTTSIFPDGTQGNTFTVSAVIASDKFELNVGVSTIPHTYIENNAGQVTAGLTTTKFPDGSQGYFFKVNNVGTTTSFTVNVGVSSISHAYVSGGIVQTGITTNIFPGNQQNSPLGDTFSIISAPNWYTLTFNAGVSTIPHSYVSGGNLIFGHKLKVGTDVSLTGLGFTCALDGGVGIHTYPRISDPTYCGTQVTKINSNSEFELNVGVTTVPTFYSSGGIVEEVIIAPRQINNSTSGQDFAANGTSIIQIVDDFTFIIDSGKSPYQHFYKRCGEVRQNLPVVFDAPLGYYNIPLLYKEGTVGFGTGATVDLVPSVDSTILTFEINNFGYGYRATDELIVGLGGTTGIPTFATKTSNAILPVVAGGDYPHTYVGGIASNAVQSGGGYVHTFVSAVTNGVTSNVGNLSNVVTDIVYTASTGDMVITSAGHGLSTSNTISIADNALSFTCTMDGNTATKTYPRSTDPISGIATAITGTTTDTITINVGASPIVNHDVTDATYTPSTGVLQLTIGSHSLTTGTSIKIANGSLTFTCDMDGNATLHSYPRSSDPFYDTAINIDAVTSTTITLNVGISSEVKYPVTDATYDPATGLSVLTIGTHNLTTGTKIRLANESLLFKCSLDDYNRIEAYPRQYKDRVYGNSIGITSYTADSITVFAGPSVESERYVHEFVGVGSFKPFELTVETTFQSKFSGWNVGEFIVLDKIDPFFNGKRRLFPLAVNSDPISFFAKANSGINLQSNLLVFINDILQTPGEGYEFTGGSTIRFTEAPKGGVTGVTTEGDTAKMFMYTGTQTIDVQTVEVLPSVEVGDELQLYSNRSTTFTEDPRLVMEIKAADKVITNNYAGQGVTLNELFERPLSWSKQLVDKIIDSEFIGKDRVYYEPVINPTTKLIRTVGAGDSVAYVDSVRPFFDNPFEGIGTKEKSIVELVSPDVVDGATAKAVFGVNGTIANVLVENIGYGYTTPPEVVIAAPIDGQQAEAGSQIGVGGTVTQINVGVAGTGYDSGPMSSITVREQGGGFPSTIEPGTNTFVGARLKSETGVGVGAIANIEISPLNFNVAAINVVEGGKNYKVGDILFIDTFDNVGLGTSSRGFRLSNPVKFNVASILPPPVLVAPPKRFKEECAFVTYTGDYGMIVGVGTTTIGAGTSLGLALDMYIPMDSEIRRSLGITLTEIAPGDYFQLTNSNFVSAAQTSLGSDGSVIGISTECADMVYECFSVSTKQAVIPAGLNGLGTTVGFGTTVSTVVVALQSAGSNNVVGLATTAYYGTYSFGKIGLPVRTKKKEFAVTNGTSQAGITTNPVVRRKNPLKFRGYIS